MKLPLFFPSRSLMVMISVLMLFMLNLDTEPCFSASESGSNVGRAVPEVWTPLVRRLIADGEDRSFVIKVFSNSSVRFNPRVMPRKVTHNEYKLDYNKFLKPERLGRAMKYLADNRELLRMVEKKFAVPGGLQVAILLVETDLGRYLGAGPAVNIISSMALGSDWEAVKKWLPPGYLKGPRAKEARRKLEKKSDWAYGELKALFRYCRENRLDIFNMKGSIFGAIGLCQFMPSNALKFGVDFDNDGRIDLFEKADACASMANYLKFYGWKPGLDRAAQEKVVYHYNHSRPYVRAILDVAQRLEEQDR